MGLQKKQYLQRQSGVELLKLIAILLIIINHLTQTWFDYSGTSLSVAGMNLSQFVLVFYRYFGTIGNLIFFTCSAWFLLDKQRTKKQKVLLMLMDIWVISVLYFIIPLATKASFISKELILRTLFPTTYENNWYLTCYILFYMLFPFLNIILRGIDRKTHFRIVVVLSFLYLVVNNITLKGRFYITNILVWITIYFMIAYMKEYQGKYHNNLKRNTLVLCLSIPVLVAFIAAIYWLSLKFSLSNKWLLFWDRPNHPIIIVMAIAALNVARNLKFKSAVVNYLSSLSLHIYIIHENFIFREHYRQYMWKFVCDRFGAHHIWLWALLLAVVLFAASVAAATVYKFTLQKLTTKLSAWILALVRKPYIKVEKKLMGAEKETVADTPQTDKELVVSNTSQ